MVGEAGLEERAFLRRTSRSRGKLFYRLLQQAVAVDPAPYTARIKQTYVRKPRERKI